MLPAVFFAQPPIAGFVTGMFDLVDWSAADNAFPEPALPFRVPLSSLDAELPKDALHAFVGNIVSSGNRH